MPHREVADELGRVWVVWEVTPRAIERRRKPDEAGGAGRRERQEPRVVVAAYLSNGWLAFETDHEKRRIGPTPRGWESMTDAQLLDLLGRAKKVRPPRRLIE